MMLRVESPRRRPAPRWAVVCWVAALHIAVGRHDNADLYLYELPGLLLEASETRGCA